MGSGRAAAAGGGLLVVLAASLPRCGDDVLRCGARSGAHVADHAIVAAPRALGPDDAARVALGGAERELASPPTHGTYDDIIRGANADDGARLGAHAVEDAGDRTRWFEVVRDKSAEFGLEYLEDASMAGSTPSPVTNATTGELRCPRLVDLTMDDAPWDALIGGFGIACAPLVIVARATDDAHRLRLGARGFVTLELARACADAGGRCVFVGCPDADPSACLQAMESTLNATPLRLPLAAYVRSFVQRAFAHEHAPVVVAELVEIDGAVRLAIARPR